MGVSKYPDEESICSDDSMVFSFGECSEKQAINVPFDEVSSKERTKVKAVIENQPIQASSSEDEGFQLLLKDCISPSNKANKQKQKKKKKKWQLKNFIKKEKPASMDIQETSLLENKETSLLENSLENQLNHSCASDLSQVIANDSGLYGDFPSFIDTPDQNESCDDGRVLRHKNKVAKKIIYSDPEFSSSGDDDDSADDSTFQPESDESESEESEDDLKIRTKKSMKLLKKNRNNKTETSRKIKKTKLIKSTTTNEARNHLEKETTSKETVPLNDLFEFEDDEHGDAMEDIPDEEDLYVPITRKSVQGLRIYDKKHACFYCGKLDPKPSRHYTNHHAVEDAVKEILDLDKEKDHQKRKFLWDKLRFKGDFYHNAKVLKTGGMLIVGRRPSNGVCDPNSYVPCKHCLQYVSRGELSRHCKSCKYKATSDIENDPSIQKQCDLVLFPNIDNPGCSLDLQEFVIRNMQKDKYTDIVKSDFLILSFGSFLFSGKGQKHANYIRQNMRILARLVEKMREMLPIMKNKFLIDFVKPKYFDQIILATKALAGHSNTNRDGILVPCYEIPSLPLKLGYALNNVSSLVQGVGLRSRDDDVISDGTNFQRLYNNEWAVRVSSASLKTLAYNKFNKTEYLPLTTDLLKLREYCTKKVVELTEKLEKSPSLETWRELSEVLVTRLTIFNKRRGNEVSSLLIKKFEDRENQQICHDSIQNSLTPLEKKLKKRLDLCYVQGKGDRQVPILLPCASSAKAIEALIRYRTKIGVSEENVYVFAAPTRNSNNPLKGYQCIAAVVSKVPGLEKPEHIKSIKLRKYAATVAQLADLKENELEWLSNHLGHNLDIHKQYYRLKDSTVELAKVSKLLLAIDSGKGNELKGKNFEDITIEETNKRKAAMVTRSINS